MARIVLTNHAQDDLRALDRQIAQRILRKIDFFSHQAVPLHFAERVLDPRLGAYRFRVGHYRIFFDVAANGVLTILVILSIKHRREAYR